MIHGSVLISLKTVKDSSGLKTSEKAASVKKNFERPSERRDSDQYHFKKFTRKPSSLEADQSNEGSSRLLHHSRYVKDFYCEKKNQKKLFIHA